MCGQGVRKLTRTLHTLELVTADDPMSKRWEPFLKPREGNHAEGCLTGDEVFKSRNPANAWIPDRKGAQETNKQTNKLKTGKLAGRSILLPSDFLLVLSLVDSTLETSGQTK